MTTRVGLGDRVRDLVTGFEGIATARITYLVGCNHIGVTPTDLKDDGGPGSVQWIDEPQLEVVQREAVSIPVGYEPEPPNVSRPPLMKRRTGGASKAPSQRKETP